MSLGEDLFDLLERASLRFREAEKDVNESSEVERAEDEVDLPCNGAEAWWDSPSLKKRDN